MTFDLAEVRRFTADLSDRMSKCDNGEGMECANLDGTLHHYAVLCYEFRERVRQWGQAIFHGQAAFDPAVERLWLDEGTALYRRASGLWAYGQEMEEVKCFVLENGATLGSSLWQLEKLLVSWVSPKPAISPLARHGVAVDAAEKAAVKARIEKLAPLPANWQPTDLHRRILFGKLRQPRQARKI